MACKPGESWRTREEATGDGGPGDHNRGCDGHKSTPWSLKVARRMATRREVRARSLTT